MTLSIVFFNYLFTTKYFFPTAPSISLSLCLSLTISLSLSLSLSSSLYLTLPLSLFSEKPLSYTHLSFRHIILFLPFSLFFPPFHFLLLSLFFFFFSCFFLFSSVSLPSLPYIYLLIHSLFLSLLFSSLIVFLQIWYQRKLGRAISRSCETDKKNSLSSL